MKSKLWESPWWQLNYPENWQVDQDETCVTFISPSQIGVLQISTYRKDREISETEIYDFASDDIEETENLKKFDNKNYQGFTVSYSEDGSFWKRYYLWKERTMVYVTYNCEEEEKVDKEVKSIDGILKTLKIKNT